MRRLVCAAGLGMANNSLFVCIPTSEFTCRWIGYLVPQSIREDRQHHNKTDTGGKMWNQGYDPLNQPALSTLMAAIPVVTLLVLLAYGKMQAHLAALVALAAAILVATVIFTM